MLTLDEEQRWVRDLGVPAGQVQRDHLLSHVLNALPHVLSEATFMGGTALCRTHLIDWRLSEDIDLLVESDGQAAAALSDQLPRLLRREFPGLEVAWMHQGLTQVGNLSVDGVTIRVQLVRSDDSYRRYPTELTSVALRYTDLPSHVTMPVPTLVGFAAMKLNAWADRATPRDLCDLFGLLQVGAVDQRAVDIAQQASSALQPVAFRDELRPNSDEWLTALGAQMKMPPDLELAFHQVRVQVADLCGWDQPAWGRKLDSLLRQRRP